MQSKLGKVQTSKNTFLVDRLVFTNEYPELKEHRFRVYLLICRVVGAKNGSFFMSIASIKAEVFITEHYVRDALNYLETNYFIKRDGNRGQANKYKVLTVPSYDSATKIYTTNEMIPRIRSQQKKSQHGYCEMPIEIMVGSILRDKTKWTDRRIKVLALLYMFHWIDMYGGVEPDTFHITTGSIHVSELIVHVLGCSQMEIVHVVRWLIIENYAFGVNVVLRINPVSCEREKQFIGDLGKVTPQHGDEVITVIRMVCIPEVKVKKAKQRTGGLITI